jgi:glutamate racemase
MLGEHVRIVDSAHATATELASLLADRELRAPEGAPEGKKGEGKKGDVEVLVTDRPRSFQDVMQRFLGGAPREVEVVDL